MILPGATYDLESASGSEAIILRFRLPGAASAVAGPTALPHRRPHLWR